MSSQLVPSSLCYTDCYHLSILHYYPWILSRCYRNCTTTQRNDFLPSTHIYPRSDLSHMTLESRWVRQADGRSRRIWQANTDEYNKQWLPQACCLLSACPEFCRGHEGGEFSKDRFSKGQHGRERCLHRELTPCTKYLGEGARWSLLMAVLVFCSLVA